MNATIGSKLAGNISTSDSDNYLKYLTNTDKQFQLCPTTSDKVLSLLNKLNKSKATGLDMISARLIRECTDLFCIRICNIFNQSISQGIFPDDWKCARVTPLFKAGDRNDVNNYRPIFVISVVAKVFERMVYDQLYAYLEPLPGVLGNTETVAFIFREQGIFSNYFQGTGELLTRLLGSREHQFTFNNGQ